MAQTGNVITGNDTKMFEFLKNIFIEPNSNAERMFLVECSKRRELLGTEFISKYYPHADTKTADVILQVRDVVCHQVGVDVLVPDDDLPRDLPGIPFDELVIEVAQHFGFKLEDSEFAKLDGRLDGLVTLVLKKLDQG